MVFGALVAWSPSGPGHHPLRRCPGPARRRQRRSSVERDGTQGHRGERAERPRHDAHAGDGPRGSPRRPERDQPPLRRVLLRRPGRSWRLARCRRGRGGPHGARRRGRRASGHPLRRWPRSPWPTRPTRRRWRASPTGRPESRGGGRPGSRRRHAHAPQGRWRHARRALHARHRRRQWRPHPNPGPAESAHRQPGHGARLCVLGRSRLGERPRRSPCCRPRSSGFPVPRP